jgi:hypothetical protein
VCREFVTKFHSAKQENTHIRIKHFPCLSCNMPKALNIEKLPAPHHGFLAMISLARRLTTKALLVSTLIQQEETTQMAHARTQEISQEAELRSQAMKEQQEAISNALAIRAEEERRTLQIALGVQAAKEALSREKAISETLAARAVEEEAERAAAVAHAVADALQKQAAATRAPSIGNRAYFSAKKPKCGH